MFSSCSMLTMLQAYKGGTDSVCEVRGYTRSDVVGAYNSSLLSNATIDRALSRLYEGLVRAGYFDGPSALYRDIAWRDVNTPRAQALAYQSAVDGIVLKKNLNNALPLDLTNKTVALIGHWAAATWQM
jgi:xylan 1,4-beta-xylosidase